jgi:hypothetical protein
MASENGAQDNGKAKKRLVRESGSVRPRSRGRLERAPDAEPDEREPRRARGGSRERDDLERDPGPRARSRRGRPALASEVGDLNRGAAFVGFEALAIAMDVASRVLRGAVDRAFDEDYVEPGDIVRGIAGEADLAAYDLVGELRHVPRRLSHRFDGALRSPRADQGERVRRATEATTPADSPSARDRERDEPPARPIRSPRVE